jgi:serine/threonine protein kinase
VKICDFGLSRIMLDPPIRDSSSAGTPEWMAPELIRDEPFDEKCDIFSIGVMMWELWTLNRPWEGVPPERVYSTDSQFSFQDFLFLFCAKVIMFSFDQVVYSVAHKGSRLEIPEGPLGSLILGPRYISH